MRTLQELAQLKKEETKEESTAKAVQENEDTKEESTAEAVQYSFITAAKAAAEMTMHKVKATKVAWWPKVAMTTAIELIICLVAKAAIRKQPSCNMLIKKTAVVMWKTSVGYATAIAMMVCLTAKVAIRSFREAGKDGNPRKGEQSSRRAGQSRKTE